MRADGWARDEARKVLGLQTGRMTGTSLSGTSVPGISVSGTTQEAVR
jgi:hypothetical protein